ncbi:unnamed protein product [Lampetra planeri]
MHLALTNGQCHLVAKPVNRRLAADSITAPQPVTLFFLPRKQRCQWRQIASACISARVRTNGRRLFRSGIGGSEDPRMPKPRDSAEGPVTWRKVPQPRHVDGRRSMSRAHLDDLRGGAFVAFSVVAVNVG